MMRNLIVVLLLFIVCSNLFAQTSVTGTVLDKDNKQPIADVIVQYGTTSRDYVLTDAKGRFTIPQTNSDTLYFQCIGYKAVSYLRTKLVRHAVVELELNTFTLKPVIISPQSADKLLTEAILNTKKNLLTERPITYLLYFIQTTNGDDFKNEAYLKYTAMLNAKDLKKNIKKEKLPYIFNLIDIAWISKAEIPTADLYGAEYHASHLFTFGKSENNTTTLSYTPDSSLVFLNIEPLEGREGWARGQMSINRDDMTVLSMEIESVDSVLERLPYKNYLGKQYKVIKKIGRFGFKKIGNKYYMSACYTLYRFRNIDEYNNVKEFEYVCDVTPISFLDEKNVLKRKLSGYCQELFYLPNTTKFEFWSDPVSDDLDLQAEEMITGFSREKVSPKAKKIALKVAKTFAVAIPLYLLLRLAR